MPIYDYDLFVLGAGSGGVRASRIAAGFGARVGVAEERYLGGTCVNVGCVPKKLLVIASQYREAFEDAAGFGWSVGEVHIDWPLLIAEKDREIARLNDVYARMLDNAGVERFQGHARLHDDHTVQIGDQIRTAETILIATGGWPMMPDIPGIEHAISSNEAFYLEKTGQRVLIVGGGYIGVEFAGIFNGLGIETTLICRCDLILRGFDMDIRTTLNQEMQKKGVDVRTFNNVTRIDKRADGLHATLLDGSVQVVDQIMFAIGRAPLSSGIGLEEAGVALDDQGAVIVDDFSRTTVPNIYAVGDVTNRVNLTPVALAEGMALAKTLFNHTPTKPDYRNIPTAIFGQPNAATVGLTEEQARLQFGDIDIYKTTFRPMKHTLSGRDERTMMKLVVVPESDRVVGVHMVGPDAGEIVQGFAVALKAGATKAVFDSTVGIHPTSAEEFVTMRTKFTD
jgi:glutathione reductase (NADPH)